MKAPLRLPRRHFLMSLGVTATAVHGVEILSAEPADDNVGLGMMLQGDSAADLQEKAKAIAAAGFDSVQLTFFFHPTAEDLQSLAGTLEDLKLKTVAFGTYFNLLRPDDTGFMGSSQAAMKEVAAHARLFACNQFVTWSGSYATQFNGAEPRNHTPEAIVELQRAIRDVVLPILEPMDGRIAFEPYYRHILGTVEAAEAILAPLPTQRVGLVLDPPNFITPELYAKRDEEMRRLFRQLGQRIQLAHFKDLKLGSAGRGVDLPGPGAGEMNYRLLISEIRQLGRPLPCIIEHINAERSELTKTRAWIMKQLQQD